MRTVQGGPEPSDHDDVSTPWVPSPDDNVVPIRPQAYGEGERPRGASDAVPVRPAGGPSADGPSVGGLSWGGPSVGRPTLSAPPSGHPSVGSPTAGHASSATGSAGARGRGRPEDSWRRGSATSFGLVGRLVITAVLVAILVLIAVGNLLGVPVYLAFMAWAMRDLWVRPRRAARSRSAARREGAGDAAWTRTQRPIVPRDGA